MARTRRQTLPVLAAAPPLLLALAAALGCGVEATDETGDHTVFRSMRSGLVEQAGPSIDPKEWSWPDGEHPHAFVEVDGLGAIEIELFPELAPETVANFQKLAAEGFYDATTFHRVVPGFMIQGGDPQSRNDDNRYDGSYPEKFLTGKSRHTSLPLGIRVSTLTFPKTEHRHGRHN